MLNKIYDNIKEFIKENHCFLIFLVLLWIICFVQTPYVIYAPGGTVNLNDRITIEDSYKSEGSLEMAYVNMYKGTLLFYGLSYIIPNWDLVKSETIKYDEHESIADTIVRDKYYYEESISSAQIVALNKANIPYEITNYNNLVTYVTKDRHLALKEGDYIIKANDIEIKSIDDYRNLIESLDANIDVNLLIKRDNELQNIILKTYKDEEKVTKTGILFTTLYDIKTTKKIDVKLKNDESGPSGGLMMSLMIYNLLTKEDITNGRKIVGTGTIDISGKVGEIGGVKYKLLGAIKDKANVFICPTENYEEVKKVLKNQKYDIIVLEVSSFEEAITKLKES